MTNLLQLTISRTSLSLEDLDIGTNPFNPGGGATHWFHLPEDGLSRPGFTIRRTYAPDSEYIPGRYLLTAVTDASSLPAMIYAHGDTSAHLEAAVAELEQATTQFAYEISLAIDGQSRTWLADPELPVWGAVDTGLVRQHIAIANLVIPINPA